MRVKILVIYHSADFDGIFCREIARRSLGLSADYVGWNHGEPAPDVEGYSTIFMLDCSIDELMGDTRLIWIDHHATAMAKHPASIRGYRIDGVAACRLAWQWFTDPLDDPDHMPDKAAYVDRVVSEPLAVRLAGEYDIWDQRDPRAGLFQHGLRSQEINWPRLLSDSVSGQYHAVQYVDELLRAGEYVAYASRQNAERFMAESSFTLEWEGLRWLAINGGPSMSSARYESAVRPEHDACLTWGWVPKIGAYKVSMRGVPHRPELDLSAVATKHGGGGHRQACGFSAKVLPWMHVPSVFGLLARIEDTQEMHTMQLAAISTASIQNTEASKAERIGRDNPYWTVAYGDVCTAIDREIRERVRAERLAEALRKLEQFTSRYIGDGAIYAETAEARAALADEPAATHPDTARLDFLDANPVPAELTGGAADGLAVKAWAISCDPKWSLREAIDAYRETKGGAS